MERRMGQLRKLGIKTVMDIDDYWRPTMDHPAYQLIVGEQLDKKIAGNLPLPDYVMTTTPIATSQMVAACNRFEIRSQPKIQMPRNNSIGSQERRNVMYHGWPSEGLAVIFTPCLRRIPS
jgi:hypothetical protein